MSIEIGHGTTNVVPIYGVTHSNQGYTLPHAMHISNVGGADASEMLREKIEDVVADHQILKSKGLALDSMKKEESIFIREIKEKLAKTPGNSLETELNRPDYSDIEERAYILPDGNLIELDRQLRLGMGEILVR